MKTWIEAALNGGGPRAIQPLLPESDQQLIEQAIACARAGAAVIHLHLREGASDRQIDDPDAYQRVFEAIREKVDVIIYPTIPLAGPPEQRQRTSRELARRGLLEWVVVDPASVLFLSRKGAETGEDGWVYENTAAHARAGLALADEHGLSATFSIYEPGFLRVAQQLSHTYPRMRRGVFRFMFSDELLFGPVPSPQAVNQYVESLRHEVSDARWMVGGLLFDSRPVMDHVVQLGGHLRVGLEDAPPHSELTNVQWVELAAQTIVRHGDVCSAPEVRRLLALAEAR